MDALGTCRKELRPSPRLLQRLVLKGARSGLRGCGEVKDGHTHDLAHWVGIVGVTTSRGEKRDSVVVT